MLFQNFDDIYIIERRAEVVALIREKLQADANDHSDQRGAHQTNINDSIDHFVVRINEIIDVLQILNPNKASGPDMIIHKMLKNCPEKVPFK